jgi:Uma2 family endonuclease
LGRLVAIDRENGEESRSMPSVIPSHEPATAGDKGSIVRGDERQGMVPMLENGDRLTRDEFERRYEAMPELKKAELIEGRVYMASPVRIERHGVPQQDINGWLWIYKAFTPIVRGCDNGTLRLDLENEPQPDAFLMIKADYGGQARIDDADYVEGAPELVAEVASSTVSYDLGDKLDVYCRNGVREYLVWRVLDRAFDWFVLREGRYEPLEPGADGVLRSTVFPGLWLDAGALLAGDLQRVLAVVQEGLRSKEHAAFVAATSTGARGGTGESA